MCLVHPPSIYDFREKSLKLGPISDVVPSTPIFEMYPMGFVSMLSYLVKHGYRARISNLAVLMLYDRKFDARKYIENIDAAVFGIDFHWLPHVHGVHNVSRLIKEIHPESRIVLGGFSATYFKEEIMERWPWVDFVLYGDFQEDPLMRLTEVVESGRDVSTVPGLMYRDANSHVRKTNQEDSRLGMDRVFMDYKLLISNTVKYHDVKGHLPYHSWIKNPQGFTIIEHGCQFNCGFCGGSNLAYRGRYGSFSPIFRDPDTVVQEMELVDETIGAPVFIAGDLDAAGPKYYNAFFKSVRERGIDLPLLTEYFVPPGAEYLKLLSKAFPDFTAEISPESSVERVRKIIGKHYTNNALEKSIETAKNLGCRKFDVYFLIGLPTQGKKEVLADVDYSAMMVRKYGGGGMDMYPFIAPLAPFLDPGSMIFEMPEKYGYKIHGKHLMDFYNALDRGKCWEDYLNYESDAMSRSEMVEATYVAGMKMVELSNKMNAIDSTTSSHLIKNIHDYMRGNPHMGQKDPSEHLTYLNRQIEWSRRHRLTLISLGVLAYKYYDNAMSVLKAQR